MASPDPPSPRLPSPERRDAVIQELSSAFAAGRLELEDLERRIEIAVRAQTLAELDSAMTGLDAALPARVPEAEEPRVPAPPFGADHPRASRHTVAVLSGTERKGRWVPAPLHRAWVWMGSTKLDFREAELQAGVTEVRLNVLMGGAEVIVPPDLDVEVDGFAVMGAIVRKDQHPAPLEHQRSRLRIRGRVLMGGIEVKVRERSDRPGLEP